MMWRTSVTYVGILRNRATVDPKFTRNVPEWTRFDHWGNTWWSRILWSCIYLYLYILFAPSAWWYLLIPFHIAMGPIHGVIINWFAHKYGNINFETDNTSRNLFKVDLLMLGEGYHNNHHKFPSRSNFAIKKGEFDPIYPVVLLFEKLKIIRMNNQKDV
jgi:stearoyl-CoA desaturase (Delta-9 desaturase)